jgi:hypothetical protein
MIHAQGLDLEFWVEVVNTAIYIKNRCLIKAVESKTPQEAWTGKKPNVEIIGEFLVAKHLLTFLMKREAN